MSNGCRIWNKLSIMLENASKGWRELLRNKNTVRKIILRDHSQNKKKEWINVIIKDIRCHLVVSELNFRIITALANRILKGCPTSTNIRCFNTIFLWRIILGLVVNSSSFVLWNLFFKNWINITFYLVIYQHYLQWFMPTQLTAIPYLLSNIR